MAASFEIRALHADDPDVIDAAFRAIGWNKPASQYRRYLDEQSSGDRTVWVARVESVFAGYVTVNWTSPYAPFREAAIPEIQDFNVLPAYRERGVGTALLDRAEESIAGRSNVAGIGVGLGSAYGAAQRLYVRRGYVPDGRGVTYRYRHLEEGDETRIDDDIVLWFTREVSS